MNVDSKNYFLYAHLHQQETYERLISAVAKGRWDCHLYSYSHCCLLAFMKDVSKVLKKKVSLTLLLPEFRQDTLSYIQPSL